MNAMTVWGAVLALGFVNWQLLRMLRKSFAAESAPAWLTYGLSMGLPLAEMILLTVLGKDLWAGLGGQGHGALLGTFIMAVVVFVVGHIVFRSDNLFKALTEWLLPSSLAAMFQQGRREIRAET